MGPRNRNQEVLAPIELCQKFLHALGDIVADQSHAFLSFDASTGRLMGYPSLDLACPCGYSVGILFSLDRHRRIALGYEA